jgi:DNA ligase (NAD+)
MSKKAPLSGEIKELESFLSEHSKLYYAGKAEITDEEWDQSYYRLRELDPENPHLKKIGNALYENFPKAKHIMFMHSQAKAKDLAEFERWLSRLPESVSDTFVVQGKMDGLSMELQYVDGELKKAVSQGESAGFNIIENVKKMHGVPPMLDSGSGYSRGRFCVRGEMIIPTKLFPKYRAQGMNNLRGAAIGLSKKAGKHLKDIHFVAYDLFAPDLPPKAKEERKSVKTHSGIAEVLDELGFEVPGLNVVLDEEEVLKKVKKIYAKGSEKNGCGYEIDGLVIKCDRVDLEDAKREYPKFQIALKFPSETATSVVRDVVWQQSGVIYTPVIIFDEVIIKNTKITRASGCNPGILEELDLRKGSTILVSKRKDVIPKVEKCLEKGDGRAFKTPKECYSCETQLKKRIGDDGRVTQLGCPNKDCPGAFRHQVKKWLKVTEVKFCGKEILKAITNEIEVISDLLKMKPKTLAKMEMESGRVVGQKMAEKICESIRVSSQDLPLEKFIAGFDISTIGVRVVKFVVDSGLNTFEKIVEADEEDFSRVNGVGPERARLLVKGIEFNLEEMNNLLDSGLVTIAKPVRKRSGSVSASASGKGGAKSIAGKSVCFTGALTKPRPYFARLSEEHGLVVKAGVSGALDYLVTPDADSGSAKNAKAQALGVKVIDEETFLAMLGL